MLMTIGALHDICLLPELQPANYVKSQIYIEVEELDCRAIYEDIKFDHSSKVFV